jgi:nucleotide-binding universal stress UspA family protein
MTRPPLVVGVDGSPRSRPALLWAADEAALRGDELLLVHAQGDSDVSRITRFGDPALRALDEVAQQVLTDASATVAARRPGVPQQVQRSWATPAQALLDLSPDASLIVLGVRSGRSRGPTLPSSVRARVIAQAPCPVVVVPERETGRLEGRVVLAVSESQPARYTLELALHEAELRGVALLCLRAWQGTPRALATATPTATERESRVAMDLLERRLDEARTRHQAVAVVTCLVHGAPAEVLLLAAWHADLMVLDCNRAPTQRGPQTGPVPAAVVGRMPCPVMVVGRGRRSDD